MTLKVEIPDSREKIEKMISALESMLATDDEKSRAYHEAAIADLKKALKEMEGV